MKSPSSRIDQTAHNAQLLKDCQSFMTAIRHGSLSDTQKVFGKYKASYDSRQALIHFRDHLVNKWSLCIGFPSTVIDIFVNHLQDGSTMVNLAIYSGNKDIVKYLVEECEANINEVCNVRHIKDISNVTWCHTPTIIRKATMLCIKLQC